MSSEEFDTEEQSDGDGVNILRMNGQNFAIGMFWNTFENPKKPEAEAKAAAANTAFGGDLYCVRASGNQYGIADRQKGHQKGMIPLAAALADNNQGTWFGIFPVNDGYYVIAIREDDILTSTDKFFTDEMDVRILLEDHIHVGWEAIYAPEEFGIENSVEESLDDLLDKVKGPRLKEVDKIGGVLKIAAFGAILIAAAGGGLYYMNWQEEQKNLIFQEEMRLASERAASTKVEVPMPWEGRPETVSYLESCINGMNRAVIDVPGWEVVGLMCDQNNIRMTLDRDGQLGEGGGTINWVRWALDNGGLKDSSAAPSGADSVEVTWSLAETTKHPPKLSGGSPTLRVARQYLLSLFEETFTKIEFSAEAVSDHWVTLNFEFRTPFDPREFNAILKEVPGLTINSVILDVVELEYRVTGSIYEEVEVKNAQ